MLVFSSFEGLLRTEICFGEALKPRKKEFEGAESKLREKKDDKTLSRELQAAPEAARSHDQSTLSTLYKRLQSYDPCWVGFGGALTQVIFAVDIVVKSLLAS